MMEDKDLFEQPGKVTVVASLLWLGVAVMAAFMSLAIWWRWLA